MPSTMDICDMKKGLGASSSSSSESKQQNELIE
jgi:hypothetical protein